MDHSSRSPISLRPFWFGVVLSVWALLALLLAYQAYGFGHTINTEMKTISIYLDETEYVTMTGPQLKKRLCESRLANSKPMSPEAQARPPSVFEGIGIPMRYEVWRRGHPNTLLIAFSMADCHIEGR